MKIGLFDIDTTNFPNLPLMKLSQYYKNKGAKIYFNNYLEKYDIAYVSKVFTFTKDYENVIQADKIVKGGTGYNYKVVLPDEIEHTYPDYSLYPKQTKDKAFGFLTRGCIWGCEFCIVKDKEGTIVRTTADVSEFWHGQKELVIMDNNILASKDKYKLLQQIIDTKAKVEFNSGYDIRLINDKIIDMTNQMRISFMHFAWDLMKNSDIIYKNLKLFKEKTKMSLNNVIVYVLVNFNTTFEEDLYRVMKLRELGYIPYVMVYNSHLLKPDNKKILLQRWCNYRPLWKLNNTFDEFLERRAKLRQEKKDKGGGVIKTGSLFIRGDM